MISSHEKEMLAAISGERAQQYVAALVAPADRVAGSEREAEGANKIKELLTPFVDMCELDGAPVTTYFKRVGKLKVVSPVKFSIPCQVAPLSGPGSGEAILRDAGDGTAAAYEQLGAAAGSAAILACPAPAAAPAFETRVGMCLEAKNRAANCIIFHIPEINDELIPQRVTNVEFPTFIISNHAASELRKILAQHKEVRVKFESLLEHSDATTLNVVATIVGSLYPEEVIYLTSHHDTWYHGANDNNASIACMLEVAGIFKRYRPSHTVRFVVFGAEESGNRAGAEISFSMRGSYGYTEIHRAELERISAGHGTLCDINGEILGYTPRVEVMCSPEILPLATQVSANLGYYARAEEPQTLWSWSDNICFHTLGIPTISIVPAADLGTNRSSSFFRIYHTDRDVITSVNPTALAANAGLMALLAHRIDAAEIPPYSLETLVKTGTRGLECLPNVDRVAAFLEEKLRNCYRAKSRAERMNRTLKLINTVNKNIFGFVVFTQPVHKFEYISEVISKLRDARNIIEVERDYDRARMVLRTIKGAALWDDFSPGVLSEINRMHRASGIIPRLCRCSVDLQDIFRALREKETPQHVVSHLDTLVQQTTKMAEVWGTEYEQALHSL